MGLVYGFCPHDKGSLHVEKRPSKGKWKSNFIIASMPPKYKMSTIGLVWKQMCLFI